MRLELCRGDCLKWLHQLRDDHVACIFADPVDNLGLDYDEYEDKMDDDEYITHLGRWLRTFCHKADTTWFSFNSRWLLDLAPHAKSLRDDYGYEFLDCVQTFSFYQHNKNDLGNAHRPLWRFRKPGAGLYPEQAKIESWRQKHGDSRATAGGKVPGDSFHFERENLIIPELTLNDYNRLLSKINIDDENSCWAWRGYTRESYGRIKIKGKLFNVTRIMWKLFHGVDPGKQLVLHSCDNPTCCNIGHLFLGNDADNTRDKEQKGRGNHPQGINNGLTTLTEQDVLDIYISRSTNIQLAKLYKVSDVTIGNIRCGKTWRHLTGHVDGFIPSDHFDFPRVTGNSKQRRKWHPTQLSEGLVKRCIQLSTKAGDWVVDPFGGTGTTLRVCRELGDRHCTLIELDKGYCAEIAKEHELPLREAGEWARWELNE